MSKPAGDGALAFSHAPCWRRTIETHDLSPGE